MIIFNIYINAENKSITDIKTDDILLEVRDLNTVEFNYHFQAYEVEDSNNISFISLKKIFNFKT